MIKSLVRLSVTSLFIIAFAPAASMAASNRALGYCAAASAYCGALNCGGAFCVGGDGGDFDSCTDDKELVVSQCLAL